MNGPDHYGAAEELLARYNDVVMGGSLPDSQAALVLQALLAEAQVHATLALAAATVADRAIGPVESWGGRSIGGVRGYE